MTAIELDNVVKRFGGHDGVLALDRTTVAVAPEEIVAVVGPSGCGKTTMLNLIAGFTEPSEGAVLLAGKPAGPPDARRAVVFQEDAVFPWLTVRDNLSYGPRIRKLAESEWAGRVDHFLETVGLRDFADAYPKQLSGGMRKRVDLARAYVNDPDILLMDEPFGALDVFTKEEMWKAFGSFVAAEAKTVVFVTHDIEEAIFVGDRVLVMTPRPARVAYEVNVPFERPRPLSLRTQPDFQQLRKCIVDQLGERE